MERALNHIAAAWHSRTIVAKLFSFATIGVLNVVVDVTVFSIAYKLFDLPLVVSNIISWSVAVSGSYAMNTKVTFGLETSGALSWKRYIGFAASGAVWASICDHHPRYPFSIRQCICRKVCLYRRSFRRQFFDVALCSFS